MLRKFITRDFVSTEKQSHRLQNSQLTLITDISHKFTTRTSRKLRASQTNGCHDNREDDDADGVLPTTPVSAR